MHLNLLKYSPGNSSWDPPLILYKYKNIKQGPKYNTPRISMLPAGNWNWWWVWEGVLGRKYGKRPSRISVWMLLGKSTPSQEQRVTRQLGFLLKEKLRKRFTKLSCQIRKNSTEYHKKLFPYFINELSFIPE